MFEFFKKKQPTKENGIKIQDIETLSDYFEEISNWKLDAADDDLKYFYPLNGYKSLKSGNKSYVIGRKGTGKTSLAVKLIHDAGADGNFSEKLSFKNFPFQVLYNLSNGLYTAPNQYITAWKYLIYCNVAKLMLNNKSISKDIREKLGEVFSNDNLSDLSTEVRHWTGVSFGISILGTGLNFGQEKVPQPQEEFDIQRSVDIIEHYILNHIDTKQYYIIFDELDEDYSQVTVNKAGTQYIQLLTGLFKAVQDIRRKFKNKNIIPIIFLREDIYTLISDNDKNKWNDYIFYLSWNIPKIKKMLAFRLSRCISDTEIYPFEIMWSKLCGTYPTIKRGKHSVDKFKVITETTMHRPRDFIRYLSYSCNAAIEIDKPIFDKTVILDAWNDFSGYLAQEIIDEAQGQFPEIEESFNVLMHIGKQQFQLKEFRRIFNRLKKTRNLKRDADEVLHYLFGFSVIGNHTKVQQRLIFKYLNNASKLDVNTVICVHRGLYKYLQLH